MGLPNPIPDNPLRWDGWKSYNSANPYERLCLDIDENPTAAQIEDQCRLLMIWWQKKLPLKNQPSNPLSQLLRNGLDEAPDKLAEARSKLLDPEIRAQLDAEIRAKAKEGVMVEFNKFLSFVLTSGELSGDDEQSLYQLGENLGLARDEMKLLIDEELDRWGMKRTVKPASAPESTPAPAAPAIEPVPQVAPPPSASVGRSQTTPASTVVHNPREEFLRMLRLSGIDEITDDQRDVFCNMGEAIGLSGGEAEDVIDDYLEERMVKSAGAASPRGTSQANTAAQPAVAKSTTPANNVAPAPPKVPVFTSSPLIRAEEKKRYVNFANTVGIPMNLVTSGSFMMGSTAADAAPNEEPVTKTNISAFYVSRWPITNAVYEQFDPAHKAKRAPGAGDNHPVVYVSALDAGRFCDWLTAREKRRYRLPTEAEWEYAASGLDGRTFPWGERFDGNDFANFADINKKLPWADRQFNTGFPESSPVGSFPRGVSPFGAEDMAGNVWEWCLDGLVPYPGKERTNPRGPLDSPKRVYRGGSWKSRIASLRTSARNFNAPAYLGSDVGFRIVCECGV